MKTRKDAQEFLKEQTVQPVIKAVTAGNLISIRNAFEAYQFLQQNAKSLLK